MATGKSPGVDAPPTAIEREEAEAWLASMFPDEKPSSERGQERIRQHIRSLRLLRKMPKGPVYVPPRR
jgi:hypothetical protein